MHDDYSFLKDELAVKEIRKHQWIESEKQRQEMGFASAALDWIQKYGNAWKEFRRELHMAKDILSEKRRHRRFYKKFPLQLMTDKKNISSETDCINVVGLSCTVPSYIPNNTRMNVTIRFRKDRSFSVTKRRQFQFESRVIRVAEDRPSRGRPEYKIFLPFNEEVRDYIRLHAETFCN